jgi:opacity protein-like surface antigen
MTEGRSAMSRHAGRKASLRRCMLVGGYLALLGVTALLVLVPRRASAQTETAEVASTKPFAVSFGLQGGIAYFTESGPFGTDSNIGLGLAPGYSLGVRASFEFFRWLALDARGSVFHNDGNAFVSYGSVTTTGGMGAVRFTLPVPHVRPYALVGFGGYHMGTSSGGPTSAQTQLVNDTVSAFEVGLGAVVPTGRGVEVGVEWLYSHLNNEMLSTNLNADGGDPSSLSFFVQYRLPL